MKRKTKTPPITSQVAVARLLEIPRSTVREWMESPDFPAKGPKGWNANELTEYRDKRREKKKPANLDEPQPGDTADYFHERALKMRADREMTEMQLAEKRGEVGSIAEMERAWSTHIAKRESEIQKSFHVLAPKLSGMDAASILVELKAWNDRVRQTISDSY